MLFFYNNPAKCFCVIPIGTNMSTKPYTTYRRQTLDVSAQCKWSWENMSGVTWSVGPGGECSGRDTVVGKKKARRHLPSECPCVRSTYSVDCKTANFYLCVVSFMRRKLTFDRPEKLCLRCQTNETLGFCAEHKRSRCRVYQTFDRLEEIKRTRLEARRVLAR